MIFPLHQTGAAQNHFAVPAGIFNLRDRLNPRRLTTVMWDQAFLMRHVPGQSFADYDRVLDETIERGHNTLRLDPLPPIVDLTHPEELFRWEDPHTPNMPWCWRSAEQGPLGA
jgi:hypothetical protein